MNFRSTFHSLFAPGSRLAHLTQHVARSLRNHPKRVAAAAAALFMGAGGAAFAVASLDAAPVLAPAIVVESPLPSPLQAQSEALELHAYSLFRSGATRAGDTPEQILKRLGIHDPKAAAFLRQNPLVRANVLGKAQRTLVAEATERHALASLSIRWAGDDATRFNRLVVRRASGEQGFSATLETPPLTPTTRVSSGVVQSTFFGATDDARLPDNIAKQIIDIFSSEIDFHRGLRKGDRFSVVYESLEADGEPMRAGRVLSVEFVNAGKARQAVWFQESGATKGQYYGLDGQSLRRAYLASPMEFSRMTSGFAMRLHPIHKTWRAHLGVDYAAPIGTSVLSVGDGVVEFSGVQNGYGNVIIVKHRHNHSTLYAHLSRINVRKGQKVSQGEVIGGVGSTGWSTGPHLHFEFRVGGEHQDPLTLARQSGTEPVSPAARAAFGKLSLAMRQTLDAAGSVRLASAD